MNLPAFVRRILEGEDRKYLTEEEQIEQCFIKNPTTKEWLISDNDAFCKAHRERRAAEEKANNSRYFWQAGFWEQLGEDMKDPIWWAGAAVSIVSWTATIVAGIFGGPIAGALVGAAASFLEDITIDAIKGREIDWAGAGISAGIGFATGGLAGLKGVGVIGKIAGKLGTIAKTGGRVASTLAKGTLKLGNLVGKGIKYVKGLFGKAKGALGKFIEKLKVPSKIVGGTKVHTTPGRIGRTLYKFDKVMFKIKKILAPMTKEGRAWLKEMDAVARYVNTNKAAEKMGLRFTFGDTKLRDIGLIIRTKALGESISWKTSLIGIRKVIVDLLYKRAKLIAVKVLQKAIKRSAVLARVVNKIDIWKKIIAHKINILKERAINIAKSKFKFWDNLKKNAARQKKNAFLKRFDKSMERRMIQKNTAEYIKEWDQHVLDKLGIKDKNIHPMAVDDKIVEQGKLMRLNSDWILGCRVWPERDRETKSIEIIFSMGTASEKRPMGKEPMRYKHVKPEDILGLTSAGSVGKYYLENYVGKYPFASFSLGYMLADKIDSLLYDGVVATEKLAMEIGGNGIRKLAETYTAPISRLANKAFNTIGI